MLPSKQASAAKMGECSNLSDGRNEDHQSKIEAAYINININVTISLLGSKFRILLNIENNYHDETYTLKALMVLLSISHQIESSLKFNLL